MRFDQVGYNIFHQHCISSNRGFLTNYSGFAFCNNLCFLQMMQLAFSKLKKMYTLYELPENSKDCLSSCFHENVDQPFFHLRWRPSEFSPEIKHMSVTWGDTKNANGEDTKGKSFAPSFWNWGCRQLTLFLFCRPFSFLERRKNGVKSWTTFLIHFILFSSDVTFIPSAVLFFSFTCF